MAGIIISNKLTPIEALQTMRDVEKWFTAHPRRSVCRTDLGWSIRRTNVVKDVLAHTQAIAGVND